MTVSTLELVPENLRNWKKKKGVYEVLFYSRDGEGRVSR